MGFFSSISKVIYREYDRRIKRASLVTEYGTSQHAHDHGEHAEAQHGEQAEHAEAEHSHEDEGAEIVNVPRGTPVEQAKHE
jgi:hypothetical protein